MGIATMACTLMIDYFLEMDSRHLKTHRQVLDCPLETARIPMLGTEELCLV